MTRLFDALSKARSDHLARDPVAPPGQSTPAYAPSVQVRVVPHAAERSTAPHDGGARSRIVALDGVAELSTDVVREMTGLRISLETALKQRIPRTVIFIASQASDERLRVLLVDAHVRRPAYWPDGAPVAEFPARATRRRQTQPDTPSPDLMPLSEELRETGTLTTDSLRASLDAIASGYDWIVIDGPPVLESPDAATLGVVADGVVVVVQAGRTKRPVLTRSVDLMNRAGGRVLGMVLNRRRLEIPEFIYRRI
jgi:hypothetical protein